MPGCQLGQNTSGGGLGSRDDPEDVHHWQGTGGPGPQHREQPQGETALQEEVSKSLHAEE